jgi:hypothetical protein
MSTSRGEHPRRPAKNYRRGWWRPNVKLTAAPRRLDRDCWAMLDRDPREAGR